MLKDSFNTEATLPKVGDCPILILHGDNDTLVDISHSKALSDILELKSKHKFHTMEGCTHNSYDGMKDLALPIQQTMDEWEINTEATSFHGSLFD